MSALPAYSTPPMECVKCGSMQPPRISYTDTARLPANRNFGIDPEPVQECLLLTCPTCSFQWVTQTKDAPTTLANVDATKRPLNG